MTTAGIEPVVATVNVAVAPAVAWTAFTDRIGEWWPAGTHSIGAAKVADVVLEGHLGGAVHEVWHDGTLHVWGSVTVWEPHDRLAFTWRPTLDRTQPPTLVEVAFTPVAAGTEVRLTHTGWEALGAGAHATRAAYEEGWPPVLDRFVTATST